jgi:transcriptional regulator with XRE-family HTH domain
VQSHTAAVYLSASDYSMVAVPSRAALRQSMPMRYPLNLTEHRKAKNLSQAKLAEMIGVEQPTVQRWEQGKRKPDLEQIGDLADALGVSPGDLFTLPNLVSLGPRLYVKGRVQAGKWVEAYEWPEEDWRPFSGRSDVTAGLEHRFGLEIAGDSMSLVYPHGSIVECVSVFGPAEIVPGKRVIIIRRRNDYEYEATVKELVEIDGTLWAAPRSHNPAFNAFRLDENEPGIIETRIAAIVVGSYRPE